MGLRTRIEELQKNFEHLARDTREIEGCKAIYKERAEAYETAAKMIKEILNDEADHENAEQVLDWLEETSYKEQFNELSELYKDMKQMFEREIQKNKRLEEERDEAWKAWEEFACALEDMTMNNKKLTDYINEYIQKEE